MSQIDNSLGMYIEFGWTVNSSSDHVSWKNRVHTFLITALDKEVEDQFLKFGEGASSYGWPDVRDKQVSFLEGFLAKRSDLKESNIAEAPESSKNVAVIQQDRSSVFLVHGHDISAKESTARFLEKLGLDVIILHEKASEGKTIIEKFEKHSNVGFAVVLLTLDDFGGSVQDADTQNPRARQNVVLELGYFTGKLGRNRVCALVVPGLELPSDIHGVLYVELDQQGGWKTKLAQELVSAEMDFKVEGLLQG